MKLYTTFHKGHRVMMLLVAFILVGGLVWAVQSAAAQTTALTPTEIADLQYMREEEKLAHDVYVNLGAHWGLPLFNNIAAAEEVHGTAVLNLLNIYGIADPTAGNGMGIFTNPDLQALYNQLMAQGSQSLADALLVGGLIEETDILDLQTSLTETQQANIRLVYQHLLAGSSNHLRAFANRYEQFTGLTYQPQILDQATFDAIMSSNSGQNGNGGHKGNGGQNGNGWGKGKGG